MKKAFTMIEVIFVIIVLGILAGVALQKYQPVIVDAHLTKLKSFTQTLNRSVGQQLWGLSIKNGHNGDISYFHSTAEWITPPKETGVTDIDMANCNDPSQYKDLITSDPQYTDGKSYIIQCKDGTSTTAPYFRLIDENGNVLVSR